LGGTFTAEVPKVTAGTQIPTSDTWILPTGLTGLSTTNSITITCAATGTYEAGEIKVTASNACGTSEASSSALSITVAAASCSGYVITNGAYSGPEILDIDDSGGITMSQLTNNGFVVSGNLCLAPSDEASAYKWDDATKQCAGLTLEGRSWRLPNIAELGNLQDTRTNYGMSQSIYRSSTEKDSNNAWNWYYQYNYTIFLSKSGSRAVRCVRSL
jgi:hypothetical protein